MFNYFYLRKHVGGYSSIEGRWLEKYSFDITHVVTKFGFCKTFNILQPEEFFNISAVDEIFSNPKMDMMHIVQFRGSLQHNGSWKETKPFKTAHKELGVFIAMRKSSEHLGAEPSRRQFRLILHAPHELPNEFSQQFLIYDLDVLLFLVTAQITTIDESLVGLTPKEFVTF